jgi:DNA-binding transcriptional LysR family regulator
VIYIPSMMVRHLLLESSGVAFLPEYFLMSRVTLGQLTFVDVVDLPIVTNETLLVTMRGRELDEPSQAFVRMIRAQWRHILIASR